MPERAITSFDVYYFRSPFWAIIKKQARGKQTSSVAYQSIVQWLVRKKF